jgi:Ca-activated chloride channel homolog
MRGRYQTWITPAAAALAVLMARGILLGQQTSGRGATGSPSPGEDGFRFRSGIELINVAATVTDSRGRFVSGLRKDDFVVYEDGQPQTVTHFSNERVPVSLGIALDTSGSMAGEKLLAAQEALDRFLFDLLGPADEIFLYRFSDEPALVQGWTSDRNELSRALGHIKAGGGTTLLDTLAETVALAQTGHHRKKAVVVISDGHDTASRASLPEVKRLIRETEVLVYAVGIDGRSEPMLGTGIPPRGPIQIPIPIPTPGRRSPWPVPPPPGGGPGSGAGRPLGGSRSDEGVDVAALRDITDDSGGRTEIIRTARDLDPATASIADELSRQYYLGYPSAGKRDGRWHTIRVEVRDRSLRVRARRGYVATP